MWSSTRSSSPSVSPASPPSWGASGSSPPPTAAWVAACIHRSRGRSSRRSPRARRWRPASSGADSSAAIRGPPMPTTLLMLPPQTTTTRAWATRLAGAVPQIAVVVAETEHDAARAVRHADAAFGTLPDALLRDAGRLRWLQAPQAAPPAGYYSSALIAHPVFVTLTVPHTPETEGFMHRARFQRMKRTAFFINIGRGMTTRLDDLVAALRAGEIAGAGLDVFEQEPLPPDHPLWTMNGVLITPHTAGHGPHLDERRFEILRDNCRRFLTDQPLRNVVDKARWF